MMDDLFVLEAEERRAASRTRFKMNRGWKAQAEWDGFTCAHCHTFVSAAAFLSGVQNRNHCPYCLWSRHLDLNVPGDRLAACKAKMKPVGLALKQVRKRYPAANLGSAGELMIVHLCLECGKVSLNRIAADDIAENVYEVYEHSLRVDSGQAELLSAGGVRLLAQADRPLVSARLFGGTPH
jgi:hypothetical protein